MSRNRTVSFPSRAWTAALILALAASACSQQSPPVTSAKPAPPAVQTKPAAPAPQAAPTKPAAPAAAVEKTGKSFTEGELAALLAPIALYPDNVVAQVLMASTYPIEIIEANRWLQTEQAAQR